MRSYILHLKCSVCGRIFDHREIQKFCELCNEPLIAVYDIDGIRKIVDKGTFSKRSKSSSGAWGTVNYDTLDK
jgi:hypothetical protein